MSDAEPFRAVEEPLCLWVSAPETRGSLREVRLEYTSRGDRVPARLLLPAQPAPRDGRRLLVLVQPGARWVRDPAESDAAWDVWAREGAALLLVDLPLHGERSSAKLSERVAAGGRPRESATDGERSLWVDFVRQSVADLRRGLDAAAAHPEVESRRIAFMGFGLGASIGTLLCGLDRRIAAAALAGAGAGPASPQVDPAAFAGTIAPRPVLFVNSLRDEGVSRSAAERLHAAAGQPKEVRWLDCSRDKLPAVALDLMWQFIRRSVAET